MLDQKIYKEIGQLLFGEVGNISEKINLSARVFSSKESVNTVVWKGQYRDAENSVSLENDASFKLLQLLVELNDYYKAESMVAWNLMLYELAPHGKSFSIDFEFNEDLEKGKTTLYRYRKRFERPKS